MRRRRIEQAQTILSQITTRSVSTEYKEMFSQVYQGHVLEFESHIARISGDLAWLGENEAKSAICFENYSSALSKLNQLALFSPEPLIIGPSSMWRQSISQLSPSLQIRAHYLFCKTCISKADMKLEALNFRNLPSNNPVWGEFYDEAQGIIGRCFLKLPLSSSNRPFSEIHGRALLLLGKFYFYFAQASSSKCFSSWKPVYTSIENLPFPSIENLEQILKFAPFPLTTLESESRAQITLETAFLTCAKLRIPSLSREICLLISELLGRHHPERY